MRVQEIVLSSDEKRYLVLDANQQVIQPVLLFMKYLDTVKKSPNTQRTYCYGLRDFFLFLSLTNQTYESATIKVFSNFLSWLVNPTLLEQVKCFEPPTLKSEKTVNLRMSAVLSFYKFLYQFSYIDHDIAQQVYVDVKGVRKYKDFLYHLNKNKLMTKNVLKLKEPKERIKVIPDAVIKAAFENTTNIRDLFLLSLLFESGLRIGEALSLYKEDIIFNLTDGHHIRLTERTKQSNDSRLKTGKRNIYISSDLMDLFDDYMYSISDFDATDYLLVKLKGRSKGTPMNYQDVSALFKRLGEKVGYHLSPHLYRHTHATKYFEKTKNIKFVQERLGHKQIQTTMNLYLHPTDKEIRKQWEKASAAFRLEEK